MSIGSRIKELRENKQISRSEFAQMIGVTVGAISNYENDVSSPKEPILFKIINSLECEPNYIFQDCVNLPKENNDVSLAEYEHIKKYRTLDEHGKRIVDFILNEEAGRFNATTTDSNDFIDPYADIPDTLEELEAQQLGETLPGAEHHAG